MAHNFKKHEGRRIKETSPKGKEKQNKTWKTFLENMEQVSPRMKSADYIFISQRIWRFSQMNWVNSLDKEFNADYIELYGQLSILVI
ncbi:MAG: hypothetical protein H6581_31030 [Bacteroidia bacterium]|nr:hypothetical protein [Bacteroidia bacterium]